MSMEIKALALSLALLYRGPFITQEVQFIWKSKSGLWFEFIIQDKQTFWNTIVVTREDLIFLINSDGILTCSGLLSTYLK